MLSDKDRLKEANEIGNIIFSCNLANEIAEEYFSARIKFPPFNSLHEGYAVILEELDELWDEVKKKNPDKDKLRQEAIQIGAMALAFIADLEL